MLLYLCLSCWDIDVVQQTVQKTWFINVFDVTQVFTQVTILLKWIPSVKTTDICFPPFLSLKLGQFKNNY